MPQEYGPGMAAPGDGEGYRLTGTTTSVASGRIAYTLGLEGPALTIDTACSSSLVAIHLAVQALRRGECTMALAGGVTVMSGPGMFVELTRQWALSPTARCRAFSDDADGTGWAEGAGLIVLERLGAAVANGRRILAVIRGSAINHDGASNGLTAPSGLAQQKVIRAALRDAGLEPGDIDAVEAHGTGTRLGDPVEAGALLATYGAGRDPERPLLLGSLKSNVGHTQAAAGVAGIIKMTLALQHELLPRTLHVTTPTTEVDWSARAVRLLQEPHPWRAAGGPRRSGVSSFGISGTNAHLILESAPMPQAPMPQAPVPNEQGTPPAAVLTRQPDLAGVAIGFPLSAHSREALAGQAGNLRNWLLGHPDGDLADVANALLVARVRHPERAVVLARDLPDLVDGLEALSIGKPHQQVLRGAGGRDRRVAFVFPGQGSQWPAMAVDLYRRYPRFREHVDACDTVMSKYFTWSVRDVLLRRAGCAPLGRIDVVQPALFTVMTGLAALWRMHGVQPSAVVGHSQGEVAAAYVAGGLSLDDAARVIAERGQAWAQLAGRGAITSVSLPPAEITERLAPWSDRLGVAAINSRDSATVSGDVAAVAEFEAALAGDGVRFARIRGVDTAGHSPQVDPLCPALAATLRDLRPRTATVDFYSTVTGDRCDGADLDADYWCRNMRQPVRFDTASRALLRDGITAFIEVSPHPLMAMSLQQTIEDTGSAAVVVSTMRREFDGTDGIQRALAEAWGSGLPLDPTAMPGAGRRIPPLPTYAFQRERLWSSGAGGCGTRPTGGLRAVDHPVLDGSLTLPEETGFLLTGRLTADSIAGLRDYVIDAVATAPPALWLELALVGGDLVGSPRVEWLDVSGALPLGDQDVYAVHVLIGPAGSEGTWDLTIACSRADSTSASGPTWVTVARGRMARSSAPAGGDRRSRPARTATRRDPTTVLAVADASALSLGPDFRVVGAMWQDQAETWVEAQLPEVPDERLLLHPALLDVPILAVGAAVTVTRWEGVEILRAGATLLRLRLRGTPDDLSVAAFDQAGELVVTAAGVHVGPVSQVRSLLPCGSETILWHVGWEPVLPQAPTPTPTATPTATATEPMVAVIGPGRPAALLAPGAIEFSDLDAVVEGVTGGAPVPDLLVVPAVSADPSAGTREIPDRCGTVLEVLRAVLRQPTLATTTVCVVTRGGVAATDQDPLIDPAARAVWGLLRGAQAEFPGRFRLVDVADAGAAVDPATLRLALGCDQPETAVRGTQVLRPVLRPVARRESARCGEPADRAGFRANGTVLVTGGTGTLGALLAEHLVRRHGVSDLLLLSRSGPLAPGADDLRDRLAGLGARVRIAACDTADRSDLAAVLSAIDPSHPLSAVIHTAGVLDDGVLDAQDQRRLEAVLRPKALAALHLHELTLDADLTHFILFSSVVGTFGTAGQTTYAAATAALDGIAELRVARGLPGTSIAWGLWQQRSKLSAHLRAHHVARLASLGLPPLTSDEGLALFDVAVGAVEPTVVAVQLRPAAIRANYHAPAMSQKLRDLCGPVRRPASTGQRGATGATDLSVRLAGLSPAEQLRQLLDLVRDHVAVVLTGVRPDAVKPHEAFREMGFDSLTAVELRNRLVAATGQHLPTTLVFDHPTPQRVAGLLHHLLVAAGGPDPTVARPGGAPGLSGADRSDPVVVVSMACRLPGGVRSPEQLWTMLLEGREAVGPLPDNRGWRADLYDPDPSARGHSYTNQGGFLYDATDFDAAFFSISPREAVAMDPQQRVLLEASWELIERAGIDPTSLSGEQVGVYIGTNGQDYAGHLVDIPLDLEGHLLTGRSASVVSGRVAYALGLQGPAITLDTACSSSLTAVHLAATALQNGECDLALAGGITIMSTPGLFVEFSRQAGLATDGRIKAFADDADGTAWSEGVALVLLERLSVAQRRGHDVLAVIRGSALNQDGASNGLAAPNGLSQQRVIRDALAAAGLSPDDIDAVEAHGTGTRLGDPIEAQALLAAYGRHRDRPLWLGALKSNIGHTQGASGAAGLIKMTLALQGGQLPRTLHVDTPTRLVDWAQGDVRLLSEPVGWPSTDRPRRCAISAFGISGTNAHVILEEAPPRAMVPAAARPSSVAPSLWALSGRTPSALRAQARQLADHVTGIATDPYDVGRALATTRSAFEHRAVVLGHDRETLTAALVSLAEGGPGGPGLVVGERDDGRTAFLFTGQGAQRAGMGRGLAQAFPAFAAAFAEACEAVDRHASRPLGQVLDDPEALARTEFAQPAIFAFEVAAFRLLQSWGLHPDLVLGHSIGEIAAAHVCGVLTADHAGALVVARARLMQALPAGGVMAAVRLGVDEANALLADQRSRVAVAAVNGPRSTVISGAQPAVCAILADLADRGIRTRRLAVSHAFHSPLMEPMLAGFREVVSGLVFNVPSVDGVNTLTGGTNEAWADPEYWVRHVREAVRFSDGVAALRSAGVTRFVEVGPDSVLTSAVEECLDDAEPRLVVSLARRGRSEAVTALEAVAAGYTHGHDPDWAAFWKDRPATRVALPTYPFQRETYWYSPPQRAADAHPWMYRLTWTAATPPSAVAGVARWAVLVPVDDEVVGRVGARSAAALAARGHQARCVAIEHDGDPRAVARTIVATCGDVDAVLTVATLSERRGAGDAATEGLAHAFGLAAAAGSLPGQPKVHLVTRVRRCRRSDRSLPVEIWGVGRVLSLERPRSFEAGRPAEPQVGRRRRSRPRPTARRRRHGGRSGDQWAVRPTGTLVPRLRHQPAGRAGSAMPVLGGTALVTGGTGGLGAHVARWLVDAGVRHLVLLSRSGPGAAGARALREQLTALGAAVRVEACDVPDATAIGALVGAVERAWPVVQFVVHAAGVVGFTPLDQLTADRLVDGLRAKTLGAEALDACFADRPLRAFVCFSSVAATWGSGGQGVYAAGNAFLDGLVQRRRAAGRVGLSIAWGPWADDGMITLDGVEQALVRRGLRPMPPSGAVAALQQALAGDAGHVVVADLDWDRFSQTFEVAGERPILRDVAGRAAAQPAATLGSEPVPDQPTARSQLSALPEGERQRALVDLLRQLTIEVLGHGDVYDISTRRPFKDLGFDSLLAVELRNRIQQTLGIRMSAMLIFDHPDLGSLSAELGGRLFAERPSVLADLLDDLGKQLGSLNATDPDHDVARTRIATAHRLGPAKAPGPTRPPRHPDLGPSMASPTPPSTRWSGSSTDWSTRRQRCTSKSSCSATSRRSRRTWSRPARLSPPTRTPNLSRSWVWAAASPVGCVPPRICGGCSPTRSTPSVHSRRTGDGSCPRSVTARRRRRSRAASSPTPRSSTRCSSASHPVRRWPWIPSNA
jgi:acyl transferase domain-containing protein/acyl carrier protein